MVGGGSPTSLQPTSGRTFYSGASADDFMQSFSAHIESLMEKHLKQQLEVQQQAEKANGEALRTIADALVKFNSNIRELIPNPRSRRESVRASPHNSRHNSPERTPERTAVPPLEGPEPLPAELYRTPHPQRTVHLPGPSASPPFVREMMAFTTATGEVV